MAFDRHLSRDGALPRAACGDAQPFFTGTGSANFTECRCPGSKQQHRTARPVALPTWRTLAALRPAAVLRRRATGHYYLLRAAAAVYARAGIGSRRTARSGTASPNTPEKLRFP
ncbi:hypothetical protein L1887_45641 [Cichorium endivia]|nr:hypothetical protein L1887_45641 [Cichorium endivia]